MDLINNPPPFVNDYLRALKPAVVRWVMPGWQYTGHVNTLLAAGVIYYQPIFVPERTIYDRIGIWTSVGDGLGGLADLRIFNWAGGLPSSLVLNAGTVPTNALGAQEIVINQTLERGYYFLALRDDQAPQIAGIGAGGVGKIPVQGFELTNNQAISSLCILTVFGAYADPALAPTNALNQLNAFVRLREA